MSNTPGAQAQASTHAFRNSPSDIDELRDNVADIAGSVGDMAVTNPSRLTTWQPTLSKKRARSSDTIRSAQLESALVSASCWDLS